MYVTACTVLLKKLMVEGCRFLCSKMHPVADAIGIMLLLQCVLFNSAMAGGVNLYARSKSFSNLASLFG